MDLHIKDVLKKYIKEDKKVGDQYYVGKIQSFWQDRFSESIVQRTQSISFSKGKLTVLVESAPLRHELFINRSKIIEEINTHLGSEIVFVLNLR